MKLLLCDDCDVLNESELTHVDHERNLVSLIFVLGLIFLLLLFWDVMLDCALHQCFAVLNV